MSGFITSLLHSASRAAQRGPLLQSILQSIPLNHLGTWHAPPWPARLLHRHPLHPPHLHQRSVRIDPITSGTVPRRSASREGTSTAEATSASGDASRGRCSGTRPAEGKGEGGRQRWKQDRKKGHKMIRGLRKIMLVSEMSNVHGRIQHTGSCFFT